MPAAPADSSRALRHLQILLSALEQLIESQQSLSMPAMQRFNAPLERWRSDARATLYHLTRAIAEKTTRDVVVVLGGTGAGKSTLINRLLDRSDQPLVATSFRRTFTSGAIAAAESLLAFPAGWMGWEHRVIPPADWPARGSSDLLSITTIAHPLLQTLSLVDTPDLDGDTPAHHAQADRAFRWADRVIFLVTPEKYQMTELLAYYRLARRYGVPALFVMNKAEESPPVDDYRLLLADFFPGAPAPAVHVIARDDSTFEPPPDLGLAALKNRLISSAMHVDFGGLALRTRDVAGRLLDQVIAPLEVQRNSANRLIQSLQAMTRPPADVDVSPVVTQLQRRLQERSILYLMGPQRILDRVRQMPMLLARLPRALWGRPSAGDSTLPAAPSAQTDAPDFQSILMEQFAVLQARIDDRLQADPLTAQWLAEDAGAYAAARLPDDQAGRIAEEELAELRHWLEQRWNAVPRDTALFHKLLKHLPGAQRLAQWSEAAPYLLAVVVATHHAFLGPVDLLVLGGWSLATWLGEKLSNEVTARIRMTNHRIQQRFEDLAHQQVNRMVDFVGRHAPPEPPLARLRRQAESLLDQCAEVRTQFGFPNSDPLEAP